MTLQFEQQQHGGHHLGRESGSRHQGIHGHGVVTQGIEQLAVFGIGQLMVLYRRCFGRRRTHGTVSGVAPTNRVTP